MDFRQLLMVLYCLSFASLQAPAQKKASQRDSIRQEKIKQGKLLFSQVVAPASAPETGFLLGSASAFTFSTKPKDTTIHRSAVPLIAYISVKGSYGFQSNAVLYFPHQFRWMNYMEFNHLVDNYWGTGYEDGSTVEQGENTTRYTKNNFKWNPKFLKEIKPKAYVGIQTDLSYNRVLEINELMEQDEAFQKYGDKIDAFGIGAVVQYDSRDMIVNAWRGIFFELTFLTYPDSWATGTGYSIYTFDYRQFKSLGNKTGRVLAWNIRSKLGSGDIPYTELPSTGSGDDIRGYYGGRFRDQNSGSAMIEYRLTFRRKDNRLSRHGLVLWTGAGEIWNEKIDWSHTLPVAGAGYRFSLQPRINIRIDAGFGRDSSAFYINITEAF